jgi:hypothetical protein
MVQVTAGIDTPIWPASNIRVTSHTNIKEVIMKGNTEASMRRVSPRQVLTTALGIGLTRIAGPMKKTLITITIGLLLPLLLTSTTFATAAAAEKQWLLKGSLQAVETYELDFPTLYVDASGSGHATHLGRFTVSYQAIVHLSPDGTGTASVSAHLVAANGDSLFAEGSGQGAPTATPNINRIVELYTITGGTGRFAGASGSFTVERLVSLATGVTSGTIDGDIVIP